jgi:AcrR family transcriptional regulator
MPRTATDPGLKKAASGQAATVAGTSVETPWGRGDELRKRRLRPGPSREPELSARNQRERLYGATVATVSELGYRETRVADLIALSGVSRSSFYRHFADKRECFLATVDAIAEAAATAVSGALEGPGDWEMRVRASLDALVELVVAQPAAAQLCFVEVHAAGPEAVELVERRARKVGRLVAAALEESPERRGMPNDVVRAVLGGVRKVIQTRLRLGRQGELPELASGLAAWAASYTAPSEPLRAAKRPRRRAGGADVDTGVDDSPRERVLRALTALVAEKGYHEVAITEIANRASMSLTTFYAEFDGKEDALRGALDRAQGLLMQAALPAYAAAGDDWPVAVRDGLRAFYDLLCADTDLAWLGSTAAWSAGRGSLEHLDTGIAQFQALLAGGYERKPDTDLLVAEAVGASISVLTYDHLMRKGARGLHKAAPVAAFVALAPFVGGAEATAVVNAAAA